MRQIKRIGTVCNKEQQEKLLAYFSHGGVFSPASLQHILATDIPLARQGASHTNQIPNEAFSVPSSSCLSSRLKINILPINGSLLI